ncbi:MAG TPA: MFS transporter [Patescibacteria group bacterium]|nr:MFS transporter [Gammaproteobacteria bacterium]HWA51499.1 MFS transporter [Patescibacteria group bacterium]
MNSDVVELNSIAVNTHSETLSLRAFIVIFIGSLYFFLDSMFAVFPAALINQLSLKYHIAATGIGLFAAIYFYFYAPLQLPCGYILDRFGPRKIIIIGSFICTGALLLFAFTNSFVVSCIARGLLAVGAAAGYLAPMLLIVRWFPHRLYVILTGGVVFIECIGAVFGSSFISYLTNFLRLETIILLMSALGVILLILTYLFVEDYPSNISIKKTQLTIRFEAFKTIFLSTQNWVIAITGALFWAPVSIFAALWGIPFLRVVYHLSKISAADFLIMVWLGIGIVSPLWGWISIYLKKRLLPLRIGASIGLISSIVILWGANRWVGILLIALFLMGGASACQVLTFGIMHDRHLSRDSATAFGFNNTIICFGNAFFDFIASYLLDKFWDGRYFGVTKLYSTFCYHHALLILPMCYLLILILSFFVKETYLNF